jgi:hypothetical protein
MRGDQAEGFLVPPAKHDQVQDLWHNKERGHSCRGTKATISEYMRKRTESNRATPGKLRTITNEHTVLGCEKQPIESKQQKFSNQARYGHMT